MDEAIKQQLIVAGYNTVFILGFVVILGLLLNAFKMKMLDWCCSLFGKKVGEFLVNRFTFLGVIHHQLTYDFLVVVCGEEVTEVSLYRFRGDMLGNVKFIPRGPKLFRDLQICLAALAPAICGIGTLYLMVYFLNFKIGYTGWKIVLIIYTEVSILLHMTLSSVDIKAALKGMVTTLLVTFCIFFFTRFDLVMSIFHMYNRIVSQFA